MANNATCRVNGKVSWLALLVLYAYWLRCRLRTGASKRKTKKKENKKKEDDIPDGNRVIGWLSVRPSLVRVHSKEQSQIERVWRKGLSERRWTWTYNGSTLTWGADPRIAADFDLASSRSWFAAIRMSRSRAASGGPCIHCIHCAHFANVSTLLMVRLIDRIDASKINLNID